VLFFLLLSLFELDPLAEDGVVLFELQLMVGELLLVFARPDGVPGGRFHLDEVILRHTAHYTLPSQNGQKVTISLGQLVHLADLRLSELCK